MVNFKLYVFHHNKKKKLGKNFQQNHEKLYLRLKIEKVKKTTVITRSKWLHRM